MPGRAAVECKQAGARLTIRSRTGFRVPRVHSGLWRNWELRSVMPRASNAVRLRGSERIEVQCANPHRRPDQARRGNAALTLDRAVGAENLVINEAALEQAIAGGPATGAVLTRRRRGLKR